MPDTIDGGIVRKITLSNGITYTIYDQGACRIDPTTGKLLTGDAVVDEIIIDKKLSITKIEIPGIGVQENFNDVVVAVGSQTTGYELKRRDKGQLYDDINGMECTVENGVLTFTRGNN